MREPYGKAVAPGNLETWKLGTVTNGTKISLTRHRKYCGYGILPHAASQGVILYAQI